MAGIYFHIPFCRRICAYCDFFRSADLRHMQPLAQAMHRELDTRSNYLADRVVRTIYFGGGTPSLYDPEVLQRLIDHARRLFGFGRPEEITVECNPDDLTDDYLRRLRHTEINRLSIGIQSFDDACLRLMNRRHTATQAIEAVRRARQAGYENITVDLIFGIDGFGGECLERTLETALTLGVQHISAYHLTIESNTLLGQQVARGQFAPVSEQVSEQEYATIHRTLTDAGFEHYEVSNYALKGFRARHNSAYWSNDEYLGIGPGAHSFNGTERRWCESHAAEYIIEPHYQCEQLSARDHCNEYVMTSLRTAEGIDLKKFEQHFGTVHKERIIAGAQPFLISETLRLEGEYLSIPPERFLISDAVIEALFEV